MGERGHRTKLLKRRLGCDLVKSEAARHELRSGARWAAAASAPAYSLVVPSIFALVKGRIHALLSNGSVGRLTEAVAFCFKVALEDGRLEQSSRRSSLKSPLLLFLLLFLSNQ